MIRFLEKLIVLLWLVHFHFYFVFFSLDGKKLAVNSEKNTVNFSVLKGNNEKERFVKNLIKTQLSLAKVFHNSISK